MTCIPPAIAFKTYPNPRCTLRAHLQERRHRWNTNTYTDTEISKASVWAIRHRRSRNCYMLILRIRKANQSLRPDAASAPRQFPWLATARVRRSLRWTFLRPRFSRRERQPLASPTCSRAYKKNDQAFVGQKNGAVVRGLMGYGRFDGL